MKHLAHLAQSHGFNTALFSTFVLVWDKDGSVAVTSATALKQWMGY